MIEKYKSKDNKWIDIYKNEFRNRLRKDLNLSDVKNVAESRKNLGIYGDDNTTHYHDERYIPKINALKEKIENHFTTSDINMNSKLTKDMNLSDVESVATARENLGISGNNNKTHYHDDRYVPLIEALSASTKTDLENLKEYIQSLIDAKANIESPNLTGIPTAPTASKGSSNSQIANTSFVTEADNIIRAEITQMYNKIFDSEGKLTFPNGNKLWIG